MPTYEYRCENGHDFEKFYRTISASESEVACPKCGTVAHRQMSAGAGLVFKGSGFYLTDYGKNAHSRRGGAPGSESAKKSDKGESAAPPAKPAGDAGAAGGSAGAPPSAAGSDSGTGTSKPK
ncbi:MAG: zinc ribbon domain-containing protein, partial [Gemmatimonadota bacterium]|nr:zinc ribbon domain-containing protein [Gemmatimonadota bacterium]